MQAMVAQEECRRMPRHFLEGTTQDAFAGFGFHAEVFHGQIAVLLLSRQIPAGVDQFGAHLVAWHFAESPVGPQRNHLRDDRHDAILVAQPDTLAAERCSGVAGHADNFIHDTLQLVAQCRRKIDR